MNTNEAQSGSDATAQGRRFQAFVEHSSDVFALMGPDATVEYVSPSD